MVLKNFAFSSLNFVVIFITFVSVVYNINCFTIHTNKNNLSPVILIPGDGGNQLEAEWDKPKTVSKICVKKEDWCTLWLLVTEVIKTPAVDCLVDNMRLLYDNNTRRTSNSPGVNVRIRNFGSTVSLEYLDPNIGYFGEYFVYIANALVAMGYERDKTIKGAPYDFRKSPVELGDYFSNLTKLIEDTYKENGQKITLIAHSLGAPVLHYYFIHKSQEWKDKHIESIITLSGAWAGAVKPIKVYAVGDDLGYYLISAPRVKILQRSLPSLAFLMPSRNAWDENEVLVETPAANYSLSNIHDYFKAIPFETGYEMYKDNKDLLYNAPPPGVEIHCLYGSGVDTTERVVFTVNENFSADPNLIAGDGDGTVNLRSLQYCTKWKGHQKKDIHSKPFFGVDHMGVLKHKLVLEYITSHLQKVQKANTLLKEFQFWKFLNHENSIYRNYLNFS